MAIFQDFLNFLKEYYEKDSVTEQVFVRDYFDLIKVSGLYPSSSKKYIPLTVLYIILMVSVLSFHFVIIMSTAAVVISLDFTLAVFQIQEGLIIVFCLFTLVFFNIKRREFRVLHREMIYKFFEYEQPNDDIIDNFKKEIKNEKKLWLILFLIVMSAAVNTIFVAPKLDKEYGHLSFNATEYSIDMDVPFPAIYPQFLDSTLKRFLANALHTIGITILVTSPSFTFINMAINLTTHIKYLCLGIKNIQSRSEVLFAQRFGKIVKNLNKENLYSDKRFIECYKYCLKKSIQHHQLITRWSVDLESLVRMILGVAFIIGTLSIAMNLLSIKEATSLPGTHFASILFTMCEVGLIAMICILGQRITNLSEDLRLIMYSTDWYQTNRSVNLDVMIIQEVTLRPLRITGFGLVNANLETFANLMNSAYSYYNLISAFS